MNAFSSETLKFKIRKGPQGFGIALSGGAKIQNPVTRETGYDFLLIKVFYFKIGRMKTNC